MKQVLPTRVNDFGFELEHEDLVLLIGSCFSDEMKSRFQNEGFNVSSNPFGTLFHPIAIANIVHSALTSNKNVDVLQRDDLYFSWDSASSIYSLEKSVLIEKVLKLRAKLKEDIINAKTIVFTFGTSIGYFNNGISLLVGNCHKMDSSLFYKRMVSTEEMLEIWNDLIIEIKAVNPSVKIVLSVSPVRHVKDGLIENNRSKARLIELVHSLNQTHYFPAYELVNDELRDYRYFNEDLTHPNAQAVNYVWSKFRNSIYSTNALTLGDEVLKLNQFLNHRSLHPDSLQDKKRLMSAEEKKRNLSKKHPSIYWT